MTTYYCDLAQDFADQTGADNTGNEYYGPGGFQAAIEGWGNATALAAGDILYLKGTGDLSKFVKITVDVDKSGTWGIGDAVQNHNDGGGASGDDWVGKLVYIDATTVYVQINAASGDYSDVDTADGIDDTTQGDTIPGANMTAKACEGIEIDSSGDDTSGQINVIGCDSSWTARAAQAVLECNSVATNGIFCSSQPQYWSVENVDIQNATGDGAKGDSAYHGLWVFRQARFLNNANDGLEGNNRWQNLLIIQCVFSGNSNGYTGNGSNSIMVFCRINGNTNEGVEQRLVNLLACLLYENGTYNAHVTLGPSVAFACVLDGASSNSGLKIDNGDSGCVFCSRMTNNGTYGYEVDNAGERWSLEDWNVFYGNSTADIENQISGRHSYGDGANHIADPTSDGYVDSANDNYNVADGKEIRSTPIDLEWDS